MSAKLAEAVKAAIESTSTLEGLAEALRKVLHESEKQEPDKLDAERWRAIKPLFRVMSANIDGNHSWVLASSSWLKGGSMEEAADRIIEAAKECKP